MIMYKVGLVDYQTLEKVVSAWRREDELGFSTK